MTASLPSREPALVGESAVRTGAQSMYAPLTRVLLKHVRHAFGSQRRLNEQWYPHGFTACPDYELAGAEYDAFVELISRHVPDVVFAPDDSRTTIDSLYVHDAAVIAERGAILCNMGKSLRRGEPVAMAPVLAAYGMPVIGRLEGDARLEAGDVLWVDSRTLAVGCGPRTNTAGIAQLRALLAADVDEVLTVPLPPGAVHLLGLVSLVDRDLAVVSPHLPRELRDVLVARDVMLLEVPAHELEALGCNILAVRPRECIVLDGSPRTAELLERAGASVWRYAGSEISRKGYGGPACLTRPLTRHSDGHGRPASR